MEPRRREHRRPVLLRQLCIGRNYNGGGSPAGDGGVSLSHLCRVGLNLMAPIPAPDDQSGCRAILENFSGQAWHDVSLTLLSGNPVTFRQSLFESYYVARPNVPVEVAGRVLPKPDTGSIEGELGARDAATPSPTRLQKATGMARSAAEAANCDTFRHLPL